jgi:serine phosphatase RsbU (regulator of sigma subunit)
MGEKQKLILKLELIKKLADSRENISLLQNMLKKEQWNVEQELKLAVAAKQNLSDVLYGLTGNEFYRNI